MAQKEIDTFFEDFLDKKSLFRDKKALQSNFTPENIPHRDKQIQQIKEILAPSLKLEKPSNLFIYGKTGTGKTLSIKHTANKLLEVAEKRSIPLKIIYLNCKLKKIADTEYRLIAQISKELHQEIPSTGLPTEEVYKIAFNTIEKEKSLILIILDEIDQLIKKTGDEILYNLTRINSELKNSQISIIGISNDLIFRDNLDPRVKSSLSEEDIIFPPYNALQLQDILKQRAAKSFEKETINHGVIEKCAAYAAREHGDARRALELLRVAGELAERRNQEKIELKEIDEAEEKIEKDRLLDITKTQPKQHQAVLYSILSLCSRKHSQIFTGEVYEVYKDICIKTSMRPLTQRRVSDVIAELDMLGIINAQVISKGRYGRTRDITLSIPKSSEEKIKIALEEGLNLS
ncbi:ORC1-type DNA replication protein [Candidatus Woesearchaeota archaeon]|nr:ORC1-type DNA replication protein [Candidatus Woesearchaeota archaeon]